MTPISNEELQTAAFWEEGVCLECQEIAETPDRECEKCGEQILPASTILRILELFGETPF